MSTVADGPPNPLVRPPVVGWPANGWEGAIWTSRYQNKAIAQSGLVAVRITLGRPRFRLAYELGAELRMLTPTWQAIKTLTSEQFVTWYRARLDSLGAGQIGDAIEVIRSAHGADPVLLCFEDVQRDLCHRRVFADWWEERTGQQVKELGLAPSSSPAGSDGGSARSGGDKELSATQLARHECLRPSSRCRAISTARRLGIL